MKAVFRWWLTVLIPISLILESRLARAHGDIHGQIVELTTQITQDPKNAELFLRRGELNRVHQLWDAAQADFDRAFELDPKLFIIDFTRGRLYLEADWPLSSKVALDRFLLRQTNHLEALITRARVHFKLGNRLEAAADYTRAIAASPEARPELFIERAHVLAAEGGPHLETALHGLDEGIQKLGSLVTLQLQAIELELRLKRVDAAVGRVDKMAAQSPRKETWLLRRAEILEQAGRPDDARRSFGRALESLETLPPTRRNVPAMVELERRIRAGLAGTNAVSAKTNALGPGLESTP